MLENRLGIADGAALIRAEERLTKLRALELFDEDLIGTCEVGTFAGLAAIHRHLFQDVYGFAGCLRDVNLAKGDFSFAPARYLPTALAAIDAMPHATFDQAIEKYIEMNVAHPFREGNGRATRIWLDAVLRAELGRVVDWGRIGRRDYLRAMGDSPVCDAGIRALLEGALTDAADDRHVYARGIDASWDYEGFDAYTADRLGR